MKQLITITAISIIFLLNGCNTASLNENRVNNDKVKILTTIFAPYDFAREIIGDSKAGVSMLLPPSTEIHSYEPSAMDIITLQECDIFIYIGGESDQWVDNLLESLDNKNITTIKLMDCVELLNEDDEQYGHEQEHYDDADHSQQSEFHTPDQHVWTSPKNAKLIVEAITDALCEADTENAAEYRKNSDDYLKKLDKLDKDFQGILNTSNKKTLIFGDRFPFRYFAQHYGLEYFAAFPGCTAQTEPSAATVAFLIDKVKNEQISVVFHVELSNKKMAEIISEATGAKIMLFHSCHNVTKDEFESGVSYIELMTQNLAALKEALS